MKYRGIINIDFTEPDSNEYTRLNLALRQSDWLHVETSAFVIETDNLAKVWRGVELVSKQAASIGQLSAFTFHIHGSDDFTTSKKSNSTLNQENALVEVLKKTLPQP
jgi:hypothetical protein